MSWIKRREIPILIMGFFGGIVIVENYFNIPTLGNLLVEAKLYASLMGAFALILGGMSLVWRYIEQLSREDTPKWENSYVLLLIAVMTSIGLILGYSDDRYLWFMNNMYAPVATTTFSLTYFYIISAGLRLFRIRNVETSILILVAIFTMLGKIPITISIYPGFEDITNWIINVGQIGPIRGFGLAVNLGAIALGIRTLMGRRTGVKGIGAAGEE